MDELVFGYESGFRSTLVGVNTAEVAEANALYARVTEHWGQAADADNVETFGHWFERMQNDGRLHVVDHASLRDLREVRAANAARAGGAILVNADEELPALKGGADAVTATGGVRSRADAERLLADPAARAARLAALYPKY